MYQPLYLYVYQKLRFNLYRTLNGTNSNLLVPFVKLGLAPVSVCCPRNPFHSACSFACELKQTIDLLNHAAISPCSWGVEGEVVTSCSSDIVSNHRWWPWPLCLCIALGFAKSCQRSWVFGL